MTNASVSPAFPIGQTRSARTGSARSFRGVRQAEEVGERVGARILCFLEQFRDEFSVIKDPYKAVKLLEKKGAVDPALFGYQPKRLSIIRDSIPVLVAKGSLKLDGNGVPYLARDPEELHAQLVQEVATHGKTSLKAQAIAYQREQAQKAS